MNLFANMNERTLIYIKKEHLSILQIWQSTCIIYILFKEAIETYSRSVWLYFCRHPCVRNLHVFLKVIKHVNWKDMRLVELVPIGFFPCKPSFLAVCQIKINIINLIPLNEEVFFLFQSTQGLKRELKEKQWRKSNMVQIIKTFS